MNVAAAEHCYANSQHDCLIDDRCGSWRVWPISPLVRLVKWFVEWWLLEQPNICFPSWVGEEGVEVLKQTTSEIGSYVTHLSINLEAATMREKNESALCSISLVLLTEHLYCQVSGEPNYVHKNKEPRYQSNKQTKVCTIYYTKI